MNRLLQGLLLSAILLGSFQLTSAAPCLDSRTGNALPYCNRCGVGGGLLRRQAPPDSGGGKYSYGNPCYGYGAGPSGAQAPTVAYPYYTTRGPRDFFVNNPPSIGR